MIPSFSIQADTIASTLLKMLLKNILSIRAVCEALVRPLQLCEEPNGISDVFCYAHILYASKPIVA